MFCRIKSFSRRGGGILSIASASPVSCKFAMIESWNWPETALHIKLISDNHAATTNENICIVHHGYNTDSHSKFRSFNCALFGGVWCEALNKNAEVETLPYLHNQFMIIYAFQTIQAIVFLNIIRTIRSDTKQDQNFLTIHFQCRRLVGN